MNTIGLIAQYSKGSPQPKTIIFGLSILELIAIATFVGGCAVGYWKYVHPIVRKYWNRLRTSSQKEEFENLLRFVPMQLPNTWRIGKDQTGGELIVLHGSLRVTNTSKTVKVLISKCYLAGFDAYGFYDTPAEKGYWSDNHLIAKAGITEVRFNFHIKRENYREKLKHKIRFDLGFLDNFGNRYEVKNVEFLEAATSS